MARKKKADPVLNWHPNFRVVESLPDIKQVRTGFVVNFAAIAVFLGVLGWTIYSEVQIHNVSRESARLEAQIAGNSLANKKGIVASRNFVNQSKPLQFASHFFAQRMPPLELMTTLVDAQPDNILFDSIDVSTTVGDPKKGSGQRVVISGALTSNTETSLDLFVTKIMASPTLKSRIANPNNPAKDCHLEVKRDPATGVFRFTITIALKPVP